MPAALLRNPCHIYSCLRLQSGPTHAVASFFALLCALFAAFSTTLEPCKYMLLSIFNRSGVFHKMLLHV